MTLGPLALALGLVGACSMVGPTPPQQPPAEPIELGESGSQLLEFDRMIVRIATGEKIGDLYVQGRHRTELIWDRNVTETNDFNVALSDELRSRGYRVSEPADRLFVEGDAKRTRLRLGGVLRGLRMNRFDRSSYNNKGSAEANVEVEFQLYDSLDDRVLFSRQYNGYALDEGDPPNPLNAAMLDAFRYLLADRDFVKQVAADVVAAPPGSGERPSEITLPRCVPPRPSSLPDDMSSALEAVTLIQVASGNGAGVIVSSSGHVLTSAHLVSGLDSVQVELRSGLKLDARVLRIDSAQDIALVQLPGRGFRCAPIAPAPDPAPGTDVFAVGSPLGDKLNWSVTRGIVSGMREFEGRSFLQTDVSMNPGNSGGPLFDRDARVVGIVSFKILGGDVEGIGFGVPVSAAQKVLGLRWQE